FLDNKTGENFFAASFKSYAVKVFYDLTRISAELHLRYQPGKPIQEILDELEIYRSLKDPCTGKSYIWNDKKQLLYGIGFDKKDNGGGDSTRYTQIEGVDFAFPVILF
ncbi:MAG: hypothetical protein MUF15_18540, partial [Acidobacteria bacterium]|nr:hypothetical protein [Acidobacteriota bacterium]